MSNSNRYYLESDTPKYIRNSDTKKVELIDWGTSRNTLFYFTPANPCLPVGRLEEAFGDCHNMNIGQELELIFNSSRQVIENKVGQECPIY